MIELNARILELDLEFTFTISRDSRSKTRTVLVELTSDYNGKTYHAIGEAVPSEFYGETPESVLAFYDTIKQDGVLDNLTPFDMQKLTARLARYVGNMAAKAGLDIAFYDLQGKILNLPLWQLFGLDADKAPKSSYTIGLADHDTIKKKTRVALERNYDVLKVKLGSADGITDDQDILKIVRDIAPDVTIRTDANAAWSLDEALAMDPVLKAHHVEFVEEPLKLGEPETAYQQLKDAASVMVMADESCKTLLDIPKCARLFHAINLKHTKTGGLTEAIRMIHAAHAHGLKIMLGGFNETSISVTAFAHLSPMVDYADLDAALLLAFDPYEGVRFEGSQIILPTGSGLGVHERVRA